MGKLPVAPANCHGVICSHSIVPEFWFRDLRSASLVGNDEYLVTGFAMSDFAEKLATLGEERAIQAAITQLDEMFEGRASRSFLHGEMHDWGTEPYIHVGYSYPKVGGEEAFATLAEPLPNGRVFFAGEHTNGQHPATATGAFISGLREAQRIDELARADFAPHAAGMSAGAAQ